MRWRLLLRLATLVAAAGKVKIFHHPMQMSKVGVYVNPVLKLMQVKVLSMKFQVIL